MKLLQNAKAKKAALEGTMLCIDPSSGGTSKSGEQSEAGYAIFQEGQLQESGTIAFPTEAAVFKRIRNVHGELTERFPDPFDLLVLEDIRGQRAQQSLIQSCGVVIVSVDSTEFFQPNVSTWKAVARAWGGYKKSDENDAIYMGYATVAIALGWRSKLGTAKKDEIIEEAQAIVGGAKANPTKFKKRRRT